MAKVGELYAEVGLKGAKEAAKSIENLTKDFGFLGNAVLGTLKAFEWGLNYFKEGKEAALGYARAIDNMTFSNDLSAESMQRIEQAMKQYGKTADDFAKVYENLQKRRDIWSRYGRSDAENDAFRMLGIEPSNYNTTLGLMDAISSRLEKMQDIGKKSNIMSTLGISPDYQYVYEKHKYNIKNNQNLTEEEVNSLTEIQRSADAVGEAVDRLKVKLGAKWAVDWGMDISRSLEKITDKMNDAADAADGFWSALWNAGATGYVEGNKEVGGFINKLGGTGTNRNWFGDFIDLLDDGMVMVGDMLSGKFDRGEIFGDIMQNQIIRDELRKQNNQSNKIDNLLSLSQNENTAYKALAESGLNRVKIAGIMGNIAQESSFDPTNDTGDNGTSGGLAQWHLGRLKELKTFASNRGKSWKDPQVQMAFLLQELQNTRDIYGKNYFEQSFATPDEAAEWFMVNFEKPAGTKGGRVTDAKKAFLAQRQNYARGYYEGFGGRYEDVMSNSAISDSSRQIINNNNANVTINADKVDEALLKETIERSIVQYMNIISMGMGQQNG